MVRGGELIKASSQALEAMRHWGHRYLQHVGDKYPAQYQKEIVLLKRALKQYGLPKVLDLIDIFFETAEGAWHGDKLTVGVFHTQLARMVQTLAQEQKSTRRRDR